MRVHDYLDWHAREHPDDGFAVFGDQALSYSEAAIEANRIARAFEEAGIGPGERVAVLAQNSIDYVLLYFGAFKAGVVLVPLNYRLAPPEWSYIVNDAGAKLLLADPPFTSGIDEIRDQLGSVDRFIEIGGTAGPGWEKLADLLGDSAATPPERVISEDDDLYQMYTSGTTGRPKGAVLTHRAVTANLHQLGPLFNLGPGDRYLIVAPLYHAAAGVATLACVAAGGTIVIQQDFDPQAVVKALSEERIAGTTLVPAMIQACLVFVPDVAERSYDELRFIIYGASPIAEPTLRRAIEVFGCGFMQGYGMTETTAALTWLPAAAHDRAISGEKPELLLSCGRPLLGTELRIVDDQDRPVPNGTIGQIIARGPQLMRGYWNLAEATAEALAGGWMHTGDAATMDDEGFVYIQDRVKDMIVSGGENVYPREIEDVLFQHPAVADAAVIGVPDESWGETVKAIVVLKEGESAAADELVEYCRGKLAGFKRPRSVDFIEALPRNPSGKVLKKELREPYWKGHDRRVS